MKTDIEIRQDVLAGLLGEPVLQGAEIGVSVKKGIVMLSGVVDSYYKKSLAIKAAKRVIEVVAVAEEIRVQIPDTNRRSDTDIAEAVSRALAWDILVDECKVTPVVENGIVTLEGKVNWDFQRESACKAIQKLMGITQIINNLRVKAALPDEHSEQDLVRSFHRKGLFY